MKLPPDLLDRVENSMPANRAGNSIIQSSRGERATRAAVVSALVERGPISASEIGEELRISATGIRRHLDALIELGEVAIAPSSKYVVRGRGRPAKQFQITSLGRNKLSHTYDDLAGAALRKLRSLGGDNAVREFATERISALLGETVTGVSDLGATRNSDPEYSVREMAEALTHAGYSASVDAMPGGVQICQHHCPVAGVAAEFPELCEAETAYFTEVLGTHVQRLATIANGDCACTTYIPLPVSPRNQNIVKSKETAS